MLSLSLRCHWHCHLKKFLLTLFLVFLKPNTQKKLFHITKVNVNWPLIKCGFTQFAKEILKGKTFLSTFLSTFVHIHEPFLNKDLKNYSFSLIAFLSKHLSVHRTTRKRCELCSKSKIKALEKCH